MFYHSESYPILNILECRAADIKKEYRSLAEAIRIRKWIETDRYTGDWGVYGLYHEGRKMEASCSRVPVTTEILESMAAKMNTKIVMAGFSRMRPGTEILPHIDKVISEKRIHLAVIVPLMGECGFKVGDVETHWREGKAFLFNPKIIHSAWNRDIGDRVVLLVDFENVS